MSAMRLQITGLEVSFGQRQVVQLAELGLADGRDRRAGRGQRLGQVHDHAGGAGTRPHRRRDRPWQHPARRHRADHAARPRDWRNVRGRRIAAIFQSPAMAFSPVFRVGQRRAPCAEAARDDQSGGSRRGGAGDAAGPALPRAAAPVPRTAVRRPAAAGRDRARPGAARGGAAGRRADQRARRDGAGRGAGTAAGTARPGRHVDPVHQPRPRRRRRTVRPGRDHAGRPDRRAGADQPGGDGAEPARTRPSCWPPCPGCGRGVRRDTAAGGRRSGGAVRPGAGGGRGQPAGGPRPVRARAGRRERVGQVDHRPGACCTWSAPPAARSGSRAPTWPPCAAGRCKAYRRAAQIVFQDPDNSLDPRMRIGTSVGEALVAHRLRGPRGPPPGGSPSCWPRSGWIPVSRPGTRISCPAGSASGSRSPGRSASSPGCWSWTSRPARSTSTRRPGSSR